MKERILQPALIFSFYFVVLILVSNLTELTPVSIGMISAVYLLISCLVTYSKIKTIEEQHISNAFYYHESRKYFQKAEELEKDQDLIFKAGYETGREHENIEFNNSINSLFNKIVGSEPKTEKAVS